MTKYPKPLGRSSGGRKALIYINVWKVGAWAYHQEEKVRFRNLDDARHWASKHGFDGIQVQHERKGGV